MNLATQLREASISVAGMNFLDSTGRQITRVDLEALRSSIAPKDVELARGDLARILHEASANDAEYIFGDSIRTLTQDETGVDVVFENSRACRFDLVIGADGLHSIVRRLAFGADAEFVQHAGLYAATLPLPGDAGIGREMFILNTPGKLAALHPSRAIPLAYFIFWHPELSKFDYTDLQQHKAILEREFAGIGWRVPEFLDAVRAAEDIYFDSVARVDVAHWARGRIALLGDASSCVSLFGDGSTLAIAGAYQLATTLAESPTDPQGAYRRYQAAHGKLVASKQKNLTNVASRIVPRTKTGIWLSTRVFWRTMEAVGTAIRMSRKLRRRR
jgi:2-polyprenyl-6-methoxyphenol hydroxylase-like FAD-dependent oxidoreductase